MLIYICFKMCMLLNHANKMQVCERQFTLQLEESENGNLRTTLPFFFSFKESRLDLCPYVCSVLFCSGTVNQLS
jgi:hypothetical protein